jgi:hypothetical protein
MVQGHISLSLVTFWLINIEGLLLLVVDHHPFSFRIHLFGRLVLE